MNNFGSWVRDFMGKLAMGFRRFMAGRYGTDRLTIVILCMGLFASLISSFLRGTIVGIAAWLISYILMFLAIWRVLSRNINKRYQENRRFSLMLDRIRDRNNCYFICPKCRQTVRVPRGKGKILITCPRCKEKFERKT